MSYRPKVKSDSTGTITDLALDAETVKGVDVVAQLQNKSNVGHTHDNRYVRFDTWQQNLTEEQKINARINIDAASSDFSYNDLQDLPIGSIKEIPYTVTSYTEEAEERTVLVYDLIEDYEGTIWYFPAFTRRKPAGPYISGTYKLYAGKIGGQYSGEMCTLYGGEFMILDRKNYGVAIYNSKGLIYAGEIGNITSLVDRMYIPAINESDRESNLNVGSVIKPVYLMRASYTDDHDYYYKPCSLYAGGTAVTLNGTSKAASTASFYAPTSYGSSGQFLKSAGENASPTWVNLATVATSGSYNDLSNKPTIPTKSSWNYDDMYVKYTAAQTLTDAQKSQARTNIGAGTSSLTIGTTASTAAAGNHTHSTTLATDSGTATVTMVPNETYKLSTGGTNVIFKTPSDAYKIVETLRKGSEADTAVGYYKIATINHVTWNFCDFCMLVKNSYSGTAYSTIFNCSCSDSNTKLQNFNLEIISGTDISDKLAYLYTYDSSNNLIKVEVFIHATRFEHPMCYILNARPGQQLVIPTQDEFNKATPDKPNDTTMTGYATPDNRRLRNHELGVMLENTTTDKGWSMFNSDYMGYLLQSVRFNANSPAWGVGNYGAGIIFGGADTKGVISTGYGSPLIKFASGNGDKPVWWIGLTGTSAKSYNLDKLNAIPTRVTGSLSYPTNTGDLATLFNLINNHRNIRLWTYKYVSGSKYREIRNLLYFTSHGEVSGDLYNVTLSYINSTGTLTEMTSGTIYYEYFT